MGLGRDWERGGDNEGGDFLFLTLCTMLLFDFFQLSMYLFFNEEITREQ